MQSSASEAESAIQNNINCGSQPDDFNFDFDLFPMSFICETCFRSFEKRWKLNRHLKTHKKPFKCVFPGCIAAFALKKDRRRHVRQRHRELFPENIDLRCVFPNCDFLTPRRDALKRHLRDVHSIEMKF
jgi:hypothetical protein